MSDSDRNLPEGKWERDVLEKLAYAALNEQRRARRWGIFFKLATFAYVTFLLVMLFDFRSGAESFGGKHTALVDITGVIESRGEASADRVNAALQTAFKDSNTQGVILRINSPGGSPVQSGLIYDEIRRLRALHPSIPMYAVVEDVCASGGYYIAAAADRIYVDKASLVGSIGVIMDGWGLKGVIDKLGVERRVLTAGEDKDFLDPFQAMEPKHREHAQGLLDGIHRQFIDVVKKGRGNRLKDDSNVFSGLIWTGERSVELGLTDGLGSLEWVAREVVKAENIVDYTQKPSFSERVAKRFGGAMADSLGRFVLQREFSLR
jgi:protease IV